MSMRQRMDEDAVWWPAAIEYLIHAAIASYGIVFLGFILEGLIGYAMGSQNRRLDYVFGGPTYLVPVLMGLALGYLFGGRLPRLSSRLIFVLPLMVAAYELFSWLTHTYPGENLKDTIWDNFVGVNCQTSECLGEAFITAPLLSSIAYTVGSEIASFVIRRRAAPHSH